MSICTGTSVHPQSFSVNKIWSMDGGDTQRYDLIQGQGHGGPKVAKTVDFKVSPPLVCM